MKPVARRAALLTLAAALSPETKALAADNLGALLEKGIADCQQAVAQAQQMVPELHAESLIRDLSNGYYAVESGPLPTCGCSCSATAAAFTRSKKDEYVVLSQYQESCGYFAKMSASAPWSEILPKGFGLASFLKPGAPPLDLDSQESFVLDATLPRIGTKVTLKVDLMHGRGTNCLNGICFSRHANYSEPLRELVENSEFKALVSDELLVRLAGSKPGARDFGLPAQDLKKANAMFGIYRKLGRPGPEESVGAFLATLRQLHKLYRTSQNLELRTVILDWSPRKGQFEIVDRTKGRAPAQSFLEFLKSLHPDAAAC